MIILYRSISCETWTNPDDSKSVLMFKVPILLGCLQAKVVNVENLSLSIFLFFSEAVFVEISFINWQFGWAMTSALTDSLKQVVKKIYIPFSTASERNISVRDIVRERSSPQLGFIVGILIRSTPFKLCN